MALTKVTSASVKDGELVNADLHSAANIAGTKLADDTIAEVKLDVSNQKIRFDQDSLGTNSYIIGSSSYIRTSFTFVRIGDT